jgi:hypothetical protein
MTYSLLYDEIEYIGLSEEHALKFRSLEDDVYFTLRDLFLNVLDIDDVMMTREFCIDLTNDIPYEDRTDTFQYTDALSDKNYNKRLSDWLNSIDKKCFEFKPPQKDDVVDLKEYIPFDEWYNHFNYLRKLIKYKSLEEEMSFL